MENCPELLSVTTLRHRLDRRGPLTLAEASVLIDRISEIVDGLHVSGQIHGAINTGNILLLPGDQVRLLTPRSARDTSRFVGRRSGRTFAGDTLYLSPEEVRGEPITAATDIWCLGAMLYEMLTGFPPFFALRLFALRQMVASDEPELLPIVSSAAQSVVDCALAKWPANRFLSAQALANNLWAVSPESPHTLVKATSASVSLRQAVGRPLTRTPGRAVAGNKPWSRFFANKRTAVHSTSA